MWSLSSHTPPCGKSCWSEGRSLKMPSGHSVALDSWPWCFSCQGLNFKTEAQETGSVLDKTNPKPRLEPTAEFGPLQVNHV